MGPKIRRRQKSPKPAAGGKKWLIPAAIAAFIAPWAIKNTDNPISRIFLTQEPSPALCSHKSAMNTAVHGVMNSTLYHYSKNSDRLSTLNVYPMTQDGKRIEVKLQLNCDSLVQSARTAHEALDDLAVGAQNENLPHTGDDFLMAGVSQVASDLIQVLQPVVGQQHWAGINPKELIAEVTPQLKERLESQGLDAGDLQMAVDPKWREALDEINSSS